MVYSKAFGHHTFLKKQPVKTTDLYDLASITKVAATTLATMKLYDDGNLKLDNRLHEVLDWKNRSTIKYISLKKLLTHHSGLQPNMPIAPYILYRDVPNAGCDSFFCKNYSETYSIKVADDFYFDQEQVDKIWERIHSLPVGSQRRYRYSDVNFVLLQKVAENLTKQPLNTQLEEHFYGPLGSATICLTPPNALIRNKSYQPKTIIAGVTNWFGAMCMMNLPLYWAEWPVMPDFSQMPKIWPSLSRCCLIKALMAAGNS